MLNQIGMPTPTTQYLDTEENPQQLISDIEPSIDNTILNLSQRGILVDSQPIRTSCFSPRGEHIALGTNSKSLKICLIPNLNEEEDEDEELYEMSPENIKKDYTINVVFE